MKSAVLSILIIGIALVACSSAAPAPVEPTFNVDATVEAKLAQERLVDATVEARLNEAQGSLPTATPSNILAPIDSPTLAPSLVPTLAPVPKAVLVLSPTSAPTSTPYLAATPVTPATKASTMSRPTPVQIPTPILPPTPSVPIPPTRSSASPQPDYIGPPISNFPSLVTPVGGGTEVWDPVLTGSAYSTIGVPTAHDANVLALPSEGYRLYYAVEGRNVMSSFSNDGLTWIQDPGIRLTGAAFPDAIALQDGRVRIYYQKNMSIGSSISYDDGLTFTEEAGLRVSAGELNGLFLDNLGAPSVVNLPNGGYRLYFRGGTEDASFWNGQKAFILSATSEDGLHFEIDPGFRVDPSQFSDGDSGAPNQYPRDKVHWVDGDEAVVGDDGRIRLYFFAGFCFGLCMGSSDDGLEFNSYQQVMSEESTPLNDLAGGVGRIPGDPTVLQIPGGPSYMYFGQGGHDVEPKELWGVYIARLRVP